MAALRILRFVEKEGGEEAGKEREGERELDVLLHGVLVRTCTCTYIRAYEL